jgi:hypothetical protein
VPGWPRRRPGSRRATIATRGVASRQQLLDELDVLTPLAPAPAALAPLEFAFVGVVVLSELAVTSSAPAPAGFAATFESAFVGVVLLALLPLVRPFAPAPEGFAPCRISVLAHDVFLGASLEHAPPAATAMISTTSSARVRIMRPAFPALRTTNH